MERVAISLQKTAVGLKGDPEGYDLFGRSAFNRYYYAVYLIVRRMLSEMDSKWEESSHNDIPPLLCGKVSESIKKFKQKSHKLGDRQAVSICSSALTSLSDLAILMKQGYAARVTADYHPSIKITFTGRGDQFSLGPVDITVAHNWVRRAEQLTASAKRAWKLAHDG